MNAIIANSGGVAQALLSYSTNANIDWTNTLMIYSGMMWVGTISSQSFSTEVCYSVYSEDYSGNWAVSVIQSYQVVDLAIQGLEVSRYPLAPNEMDNVTVDATVEEPSGIETAILSYSIDNGSSRTNMTMAGERTQWTAVIPAFPLETRVMYKVYVEDAVGNWGTSFLSLCGVGDSDPPVLHVSHFPSALGFFEPAEVVVEVIDPSGPSNSTSYLPIGTMMSIKIIMLLQPSRTTSSRGVVQPCLAMRCLLTVKVFHRMFSCRSPKMRLRRRPRQSGQIILK